MKKTFLLLILILAAVFLGTGCCGKSSDAVVLTENGCYINKDGSYNITAPPNPYKTTIEEGDGYRIFTGKVAVLVLREPPENDVVVFEDNTIVTAYPAEKFVWKMGKINKVKIIDFMGDYQIEKVE